MSRGAFVAVVGEVGSGKTSLLMALMSELHAAVGSVSIRGTVAYVPQNAWIMSGTVRENITLAKPFDPQWYQRVVEGCCLQPDLDSFEQGDMTEVRESCGGVDR